MYWEITFQQQQGNRESWEQHSEQVILPKAIWVQRTIRSGQWSYWSNQKKINELGRIRENLKKQNDGQYVSGRMAIVKEN